MIMGDKHLYGKRLQDLPLTDLTLVELAQLHTYLVQRHGEDSPLVLDPIKVLEKSDPSTVEESYDEGYEAACTEADDNNRYDDGWQDGYDSAKQEFGDDGEAY